MRVLVCHKRYLSFNRLNLFLTGCVTPIISLGFKLIGVLIIPIAWNVTNCPFIDKMIMLKIDCIYTILVRIRILSEKKLNMKFQTLNINSLVNLKIFFLNMRFSNLPIFSQFPLHPLNLMNMPTYKFVII